MAYDRECHGAAGLADEELGVAPLGLARLWHLQAVHQAIEEVDVVGASDAPVVFFDVPVEPKPDPGGAVAKRVSVGWTCHVAAVRTKLVGNAGRRR